MRDDQLMPCHKVCAEGEAAGPFDYRLVRSVGEDLP